MPKVKTLKFCLYSIIMTLFAAEASLAKPAALSVSVVDNKGNAVKDAVVSLVKKNSNTEINRSELPTAMMTQKDIQFAPFVLPVVKGTTVKFPNLDTERHYIYSASKSKSFELAIEVGEEDKSAVFDQVGTIHVICAIHDNMKAYIHVVDTLNYGKSDANGMIKLDGLDAGEYQAVIWHPRLKGNQKKYIQKITLDPTAHTQLTFKIPLKRERRPRKSKGNY